MIVFLEAQLAITIIYNNNYIIIKPSCFYDNHNYYCTAEYYNYYTGLKKFNNTALN